MKKYKNKLKSMDFPLIIILILLVFFGLIAVTSASYPEGVKNFDGDGFYFAKRQLIFSILGFIGVIVVSKLPRKTIRNLSGIGFIVGIFLIFALWTPLGWGKYGQIRWIRIPSSSFKFQPSDILKITSIVYMAKLLDINKKNMGNSYTFYSLVLIMAISVVPIMLKDLSTAVVIGISLFSMYFVGGIKSHQFVTLLGIGGASIVPMIVLFPYRIKRMFSFFTDSGTLTKDKYQITQSLYAIAMGGFGGVGLFHSRQKYSNVPLAYNDFIFPIICEEFGIIGAIFLIFLFFMLIYRGYLIAYKAKNYYDKYVAVGITTYIGIQAIFNLGVGCGLFPVTGITLPFISYGGTSLMLTMISIGLLLRISRDVEE
ncbi:MULTISPECIES: FtsW/RodA/SpoVE family cell cycle protein [Peptoniphilus]|uniref:FtsW/RodA/SpoVE family cell cycle protein n=1 Tax=Peptoniphilus TaxID=162289 RepID=UPI0001DA9BF7|nr:MULTISPECIES: putative peptidoglycan glycosyltransferase FtsW [Peptoniphilus]EFI42180.1 putative cell division protein FtsW [Peptoniphilus sp. oral taxon 386 str. F0131]